MESLASEEISVVSTSEHIIISPANKKPDYCLIFLHGLSTPIQTFRSNLLSGPLAKLTKDFKIYIPQAPVRPMKRYGDTPGFSWYSTDKITLDEITEKLSLMIEEEIKLFDNDAKKIFIGGFSQGTAVAMNIVSTLKFNFGGVIIVGGFVSEHTKFEDEKDLPDLLIVHGDRDAVITLDNCKKSFGDLLKRPNTKLEVVEGMHHNISNEDGQRVIYEFIRSRASDSTKLDSKL